MKALYAMIGIEKKTTVFLFTTAQVVEEGKFKLQFLYTWQLFCSAKKKFFFMFSLPLVIKRANLVPHMTLLRNLSFKVSWK